MILWKNKFEKNLYILLVFMVIIIRIIYELYIIFGILFFKY